MIHSPLLAGIISDAARNAAGPLLDAFGGGAPGAYALVNLAIFLVQRAWLIVGIAVLYNIVRAGIKLINSQEEDGLTEAKRAIATSVAATFLAFLTPRLIEGFYLAGGEGGILQNEGTVRAGAAIISEEIFGIINWVTYLVAILAIAMIVVSGFRAVGSFGKEGSLDNVKNTLFGVVMGIFLLIVSGAIKLTLGIRDVELPGTPSTSPIILRIVQIISGVMVFLGILTTAVIVYAGLLMMLNFGNDEQYSRGKSIILRAGIGLAVIFVSYVIVTFVTSTLAM